MIITHAGILLQPEVHIQQQISEGLRQGTWGGHGAWASPEVVADGATVLAVGATGGEDRGMGEDGSTSLARAIAVLMVLGSGECAGGEGLGVVQIARLVGKEKTQVSRTLKALAEAGLVIRDAESLRYRLGWRLFTLAATAADQQLLALTPHVLRAPVGAGWLRPVDVVVGEPAVGDSGGAVGGPDRAVALHVGGAGVVV